MKAYSFVLSLLAIILIAGSCTNFSNETTAQSPFFDLKQYMQQQQPLLAQYPQVEKTTSINGQTESKLVDKIDFTKELEVFVASDINRASWLDRYQVDSTFDQTGQLSKLVYQALDDKLRTRELSINFQNAEVKTIAIRNASSNAITDSEQLLNYAAGVGYSIHSRQKVVGAEERKLSVSVKLLK